MNDSLEKGVGGSMNLSDYVELKGIKKGIEQGRRDGIRNMIELCQDLGTTEDNAKSQIIMRFRIPEEEAIQGLIAQARQENEKRSLLKKNNGSDIPDKAAFVVENAA